MSRKRIAVLGAGPAGSSFVLSLLARGVDPSDVVVLDKARFPRPKLCGGGVTYRGTEILRELLGEPPKGAVVTRGLVFRSEIGAFPIRERGPQWVYERTDLDLQLMEACRARGVEVREEQTVSALEPGVDGWRVKVGGRTESFDWVVGADGANGISRRASGLRGGITGRLVEAVYEPVSADVTPETLIFDFDPILDGIPGYAWIFPCPLPGGGVAYKLGVMDGRGVASGEHLRAWTARFAERNGYRLADSKIHGWPERYYDYSVRGQRPGLMLIGEALGIDALLGEGIAPAIYNAVHAAGVLRGALDRGARAATSYDGSFLRSPEGRNLWFQARLADRLYGSGAQRWLRVLFDMPHLHALAGSGREAYGRLAGHVPGLVGRFAMTTMLRGLPTARPIRPALPAVAESRAVQ